MPNHKKRLHQEILKSMSALLTAAFGLVAALAWNGAIQSAFKLIFGTPDALIPQLIYAIVVTVIAVVVIVYIGRLMGRLHLS
ncbi:MAG: hypothetical protein KGH60_05175 [Candidatus Micrarchaeota archaeon]|nr:hypothetical protein [Candidatus Micrarchaeota archaeon]